MNDVGEQEKVVLSILQSLDDYLASKDFEFLFRLGSKLSFIAYSLNASSDDSLVKVVPSLIHFTEIVYKISEDDLLSTSYDELIAAYLKELSFWLRHAFIDKKEELLPSNIVEVLISGVQSIDMLLNDTHSSKESIEDIFF